MMKSRKCYVMYFVDGYIIFSIRNATDLVEIFRTSYIYVACTVWMQFVDGQLS